MLSDQINSDMPIIQKLEKHLEIQLALCDALEKIADGLPNDVDRQECLHVATHIYAIVKRAHSFEEEELFPIIRRNASSENVEDVLQHLHSDHWEDESYAEELQDALFGYITRPQSINVDALSYMLRGFFGSLRRHIAFEQEYFVSHTDATETRKSVH